MTLTPLTSPSISDRSYFDMRKLFQSSLRMFQCKDADEIKRIQKEILAFLENSENIYENCSLLSALFYVTCQILGISSIVRAESKDHLNSEFMKDHLFSWGEVCYPKMICEQIALLTISLKFDYQPFVDSKIKELEEFLLNTLDDLGEPIFSLFSQLDKHDLSETRAAYFLFFSAMSSIYIDERKNIYEKLAGKQKIKLDKLSSSTKTFFIEYALEIASAFFPSLKTEIIADNFSEELVRLLPSKIIDKKFNFVAIRTSKMTQMFIGKGCKSGMGFFKLKNCGIQSYGPQLSLIGDGSHFGILGNGSSHKYFRPYIEGSEKAIAIDSHHLIGSKGKESAFTEFEENGFSGLWINAKQRGDERGWSLSCTCEGLTSTSLYFVFYLKTESCIINRSQKLRPRSLDRYKGPVLDIECKGEGSGFILSTLQGSKAMEVIPLAGDNSFWGADFLVAYKFNLPQQSPFISLTHQWKVQLLQT